jgi:hypothetical protein
MNIFYNEVFAFCAPISFWFSYKANVTLYRKVSLRCSSHKSICGSAWWAVCLEIMLIFKGGGFQRILSHHYLWSSCWEFIPTPWRSGRPLRRKAPQRAEEKYYWERKTDHLAIFINWRKECFRRSTFRQQIDQHTLLCRRKGLPSCLHKYQRFRKNFEVKELYRDNAGSWGILLNTFLPEIRNQVFYYFFIE